MASNAPSVMNGLVAVPPGISWTMPEKSMAWQNPPRYTKLTEIADNYINILSDPELADDVLDSVESGVPIAVIAETLMLHGVQGGFHTVDMGTLVMPVIIEMLRTAAEVHGVEYITFPSEAEKGKTVTSRMAREVVNEVLSAKMKPAPEMEEEMPMEQEKPKGLMARKQMENM